MELFHIMGRIFVDDGQASRSLQNIDRQASNTESSFGRISQAGSKMGSMIIKYAGMATSALAAVAGVTAGIKFDSMMENSQVAWETLLGGADKAKNMLQDINKFAKNTQFDTTSVDAMAKYMHNAGLEGQGLFDSLTKVADVSGAFNIPAADAQELVRQMSQVRQAGVAYTEDLNILQDRGVPIFQALADVTGTNVAAVKKMASEGKITSDLYIKAFDQVANSVKGSSEKQSKTLTGMLSTLQDNLSMISGILMQGAFDKLKSTMEAAMPYIERFATTLKDEGLRAALSEIFGQDKVDKAFTLFNTIKDIGILAFNGFKDAIKFVIDNLNILIPVVSGAVAAITAFKVITTINTAIGIFNTLMAAYRAGTLAATLAQLGLNTAMLANPFTWVAVAIGALIAAGILLYQNWDTVKNKMQVIWMEIQAGAETAINAVINKINDLIRLLNKIPGVSIPLVPKVDFDVLSSVRAAPGTAPKGYGRSGGAQAYASGTNFAPGGLSLVGERGPELIDLPRGSKVYTADQTAQMMKRGNTYNFYPQKAIIDDYDIMRAIDRTAMLYGN
jgi:tape measure domain-containing protein